MAHAVLTSARLVEMTFREAVSMFPDVTSALVVAEIFVRRSIVVL